mgnify:FL=1|tara:strand:+ start:4377 stop:4616 length:240 start_codon:yes stop_codon:yes gene_type:complete
MPKRKYMAPAYITEQLEGLALIKTSFLGRKIKRTSLHAAHQRFREYDGPEVMLHEMMDGRIRAEFAPTIKGHQHEDEIL